MEKKNKAEIMVMLNAVSVFNQIAPEDMSKEQQTDLALELICQYVTAGEKTLITSKIKSKAV